MTELLQNIFGTIFQDNVILATILIAMVPIIELRLAIPFGTAADVWGAAALSYWESFLFAFLGSSLIVFILAPIIKPIINWLKKTKLFKKIATWFEDRILTKSQKIQEDSDKQDTQKKSKWKKILGVFLFVAIPLPLTGVWTGTCIAVFLGLNYLETSGTIVAGNLCAGLIMTAITAIFKDKAMYVVYGFLAIVVLLLVIGLLRLIIKNIKAKKNNESVDSTTLVNDINAENS